MKTMREDNLVILRGFKPIEISNETYYPNKYYRSIALTEGDRTQILVFGKVFNKEHFDETFEFAHARVLRDWTEICLLKEGNKPLTKKAFNEQADVHVYGNRSSKIRIIYFRNSREPIYGFYVYNSTKAKDLKDAYEMYIETINGSTEYLDSKEIQFGNRGIPIAYGDLGVWKETPKPFIL